MALLACLLLIAALGYALHLMTNQRDPADVLKEKLVDPSYAAQLVEEGDPSFYMKLSIIGAMARGRDAGALRALITVSRVARRGRDRDFLSYWLAQIAAYRPELFLAVCSRMKGLSEKAVEMAAWGIAHYGKHAAETPVTVVLTQSSRGIDETSKLIVREAKKARRVESREEAEKDPGGPG